MNSRTFFLLLFGGLIAAVGCHSPRQNNNSGAGNNTSGQASGSGEGAGQQLPGQTAPDPLFLKLMNNGETFQIVAGKSAGILQLKKPSDTLRPLLGAPDSTAVDMCKDLSAWYTGAGTAGAGVDEAGTAGADEAGAAEAGAAEVASAGVGAGGIRIYSLCDNDLDMRKSIQIVALRGAPFETAEGASAESTFPELKQQYSGLQVLGSVQRADGGSTLFIADDVEAGIAFELSDTTARGRCLGVLIHLPGKAVSATNIPLYPGLEKFGQ